MEGKSDQVSGGTTKEYLKIYSLVIDHCQIDDNEWLLYSLFHKNLEFYINRIAIRHM